MDEEEYAAEVARTVPRYLYKYRSLAGDSKEFTRDLIINQNLYFPAPADLNDPFECKPNLETLATIDQQKRYAAGLVNRTQAGKPRAERKRLIKGIRADRAQFRQTILVSMRATLEAVGVYSLSARHLSLLMWPHYADNHRGVCVRFDMQALLNAEQVPFPVQYEDQRPTCDTILEPTAEWLNKAVLTKGQPWEYEQEWRLVRNRGAKTTLRLTAPTVNGVLLGANISDSDRAEVRQWVRDAGRPVGVAQAKFHPTAYELEIANE